MIEVTVRMLPHGNAAKARIMGRLLITNTGTGTATRGNYITRLYARSNSKPYRTGSVKNYPRKAFSVWVLIFTALARILISETK